MMYSKRESELYDALLKRRTPVSTRYWRITPIYIRTLCIFIGVPIKEFMETIGLKHYDYTNFVRRYHPHRHFGKQMTFQCGIFWIVKLLYHRGIIPYSLAQLGGIYHKAGIDAERAFIKRMSSEHRKSSTKKC